MLHDSNVTLRAVNEPINAETVALLSPRGELDFNGRRTHFNIGYAGALEASGSTIGVLAGSVFPYDGLNAVIQETHIFNPRVLNVFNVAYNRSHVFNSWENTPTSVANELGIKIKQTPPEYGLPAVGAPSIAADKPMSVG